ncbi:MAG: diguanylate cyclase domain-containing protein [Nocardioidaceae bacterium]
MNGGVWVGMDDDDASLALPALAFLVGALPGLQTSARLDEPLQTICDGLVSVFGCRCAAIYLVSKGDAELGTPAASSGSRHRRGLSSVRSAKKWEALLSRAEPHGRLRLLHGGRTVGAACDPTLLLAPLEDVDGGLVGVIELELDADAPPVGHVLRSVLQLVAAQTGLAVLQRTTRGDGDGELALVASEERFRLAFENAPIGMVETLVDDELVYVARINRAAGRMFGVEPAEVQGRLVDDILATSSESGLAVQLATMVERGNKGLHLEARFTRNDGAWFWGLVEAAPLPDVDGRSGVLCQIVDISATKATEEELKRLAHMDHLTGLPNRAVLLERLGDVVRMARESGQLGALLFCDLDHFKGVNDRFGHLAGDEALSELARRLRAVVRRSDIVGRFGGDEFVVVAFPLTVAEAEQLSERLEHALASPLLVEEARGAIEVGGSVGLAMIDGARPAVAVLGEADAAMYEKRARERHPRLGTVG